MERGTALGAYARMGVGGLQERSIYRSQLVESGDGFAAVDAYYYRWWCYFSHGVIVLEIS